MRIAHVMGSGAQGGAEAFFERLCLAQAAAGETVLPVVRRDPAPDGRNARLRAAGLDPLELPFGNPLDLVTRLRLRQALHRFAPEVVVAWQNRAASFAPRGPWTLVGRLGGYYDLRYYRRCDHLVGNTRGLREYFVARGWPAARAHHVPNFANDFAGCAPAALPAPPGMTRLLALGRLHRNKGFDVLLRALALLPGLHLSLAGEGPERGALTALAASLGVADRVAFLGWREDTGALLAGCDLFVCPSRHEPLGNVVLEAWSAGRPVVAAASQGPTELIEPGVTGRLAAVDDPAALAAALAAVAGDPAAARAMAAAGQAVYRRHFATAPVLARWRRFLEDVAAGGARRGGSGQGESGQGESGHGGIGLGESGQDERGPGTTPDGAGESARTEHAA
ncbi:glycosyltransferase [Roseomonas sp. NAR14]|uniref:Glycosyltransferase n=1 Tax=Roseomonas acroporae TaxID=2937791 RepID=A0A9X1Y6J6_9PROT|nr:glycosyltransferase [Roseomonas acroporae]MCK8782987.1 glycosyltransferase [Roseomonas acroporae]